MFGVVGGEKVMRRGGGGKKKKKKEKTCRRFFCRCIKWNLWGCRVRIAINGNRDSLLLTREIEKEE